MLNLCFIYMVYKIGDFLNDENNNKQYFNVEIILLIFQILTRLDIYGNI